MRWKQHVIGTLIAAVVAFLILLAINLLMPSQMVVTKSVVMNQSMEQVMPYLSTPDSVARWYKELNGARFIQKPNTNRYQFVGQDGEMHELVFTAEMQDGKSKMEYYSKGEKKAIFFFQAKPKEEQTVVEVRQFWNLGWNPLSKLMAKGREEETEKTLQINLLALKRLLNRE